MNVCDFGHARSRCRFLFHLTAAIGYFCGAATLAAEAGKPEPASSFELPTWVFDRGNAIVVATSDSSWHYQEKWPDLLVGGGTESPWYVEYDIDFPVEATWTLHIRYMADEPRPLEFWFDGRRVGACCASDTRTPTRLTPNSHYKEVEWHPQPPRLQWEEAAELDISKGKHTIKLTCEGPPPGVATLRLDSSKPFSKDWLTGPGVQLPDERRELISRMAHVRPPAWRPIGQLEKIDRLPPIYRTCFLPPGSVNTATLRLAIEDMIARYGDRYPQGWRYLERLNELAKKRKEAYARSPAFHQEVETALDDLRREAMLSHPLLDFDKLLFVKRPPSQSDHIYTHHYGGKRMGGNLYILSPVAPDGKVTELAPQLSGGLFGGFDLSFDARRVVFSYQKSPDDHFRIYEIGVDGSGLRQLTFDSEEERELESNRYRFEDCDPCYLPDGRVLFVSTRSKRHVLCFGSSVTSLYVISADGSGMQCISESPLNEMTPSLLDDGRVVYTRWEYIDKPLGSVQSLWAVRPDGSHSTHVYKNDVQLPYGLIDPRGIPGESNVFVAIGAGHCGPAVGPVLLIDNRLNRRSTAPLTNITPEVGLPGMFNQKCGKEFGYFKTPFPLSENCFLVSHTPSSRLSLYDEELLADKRTIRCMEHNVKGYGIYLLDAWGNRAELYRDPEISCFQPIPLRPRQEWTELVKIDPAGGAEANLATVFLQDVYEGLTGIERGRVKYLRVMEAIGVTWQEAVDAKKYGHSSWGQKSIVSDGIDIHIKKVHGVTTVHDDGSAYFNAPAKKNLFFQALDENYIELQRMRTFVNFMPGEKRSCIGCHEHRQRAPTLAGGQPLALTRPPEELRPQAGDRGPRAVHYASDVRPIFQRRCVGCHSGEKPAGDLDLTGELTKHFDRSYETLIDKELLAHVVTSVSLPPLMFGSHQSRLVDRIREAPCGTGLTREEFIRIVTWVDADAPYYGTHEGKKNLQWKDAPDFRPLPDAE